MAAAKAPAKRKPAKKRKLTKAQITAQLVFRASGAILRTIAAGEPKPEGFEGVSVAAAKREIARRSAKRTTKRSAKAPQE